MKLYGLMAISIFSFAACADSDHGPAGTHFAISVAPLSLPGLTNACYDLTVYDSSDLAALDADADDYDALHTVWSQANLCATQYGDSQGSISYVGTCDAQVGDNTVELVLDTLSTAAKSPLDEPADYVNPCPSDRPCRLVEPCTENADTSVTFNLTVLRSADQGFFDVAVDFSDIFCSAKFDCTPGDFLYDGTGKRAPTAVLGFACTSGTKETGEAAATTYMYLDDITLWCDDGTGTDTKFQVGEAIPVGHRAGDLGASGDFFGTAAYEGAEFADADFNKDYWNVALGVDVSALPHTGCEIRTKGTASNTALGSNRTDPTKVYPFVSWAAPLTTDGTALTCGNIQIGQAGVDIEYTTLQTNDFKAFDNCGTEDASGVFSTKVGTCN